MLSKTFASLVKKSTQGRSSIIQTALKATATHQTPTQGSEESSEQISARQFSTQVAPSVGFTNPELLKSSHLNGSNNRGYASQSYNETTPSESVGKNVKDVFLNIAKAQNPDLALYIDKAQEIEQGNDESKKAEQYSSLWKTIAEDGGKELQSQFAETLGKAKDLKRKAQFVHELDSMTASLIEEGKLSPESTGIESLLLAVPKKDGRRILTAYDELYQNPQNSDYEEKAQTIVANDIYSESVVGPSLLRIHMEQLQQTPIKEEPSLPDRLDIVPPIGTTIEQFTTKIGILSNGFSKTQVKEKFDEAIETLELDENPTTGKLKKTLTDLAGYLADYAKDELGPDNTKTPEEKTKRDKDLFTTVNTVKVLEEEADNVSELEKFYVDMAKIVKIGKARSADTFFDDSVEIQ